MVFEYCGHPDDAWLVPVTLLGNMAFRKIYLLLTVL